MIEGMTPNRKPIRGKRTELNMKPKPRPDAAFPMESVFPGLAHKYRPDIERQEAEDFLEYGAKASAGCDVHDPATRTAMIDCGPEAFIGFEPKLPPDLAARLAALPDRWEEQPDAVEPKHPGNILAEDIAAWCNLPLHLYVFIDGNTATVESR
jgi:hypothetical protein